MYDMILVLLLILQTHASHDTHNPCASVWIGSNTAGDSVQVYEALVENLTHTHRLPNSVVRKRERVAKLVTLQRLMFMPLQ